MVPARVHRRNRTGLEVVMSLKALMSRITHRGSRPSSEADRALADARADAARQQRKQGDHSQQHGWGMQSGGGGIDGGGF